MVRPPVDHFFPNQKYLCDGPWIVSIISHAPINTRKIHMKFSLPLSLHWYYVVSLSIWHPWTPIVLNIGRWCSKPRAETKGALGYVPMVYTVLHYPLQFHSVLSSPTRPLPPPCLQSTSSYPPLIILPQTHKTQYLLISPTLGYPWYRPPLCLQEKFHSCILAPRDVGLHLLQAYLPHILLQRGLFPCPILPAPWLFLWDPPHQPVVEYLQQPFNAWGHDPSLCTEYQDGLHYFKLEATQCLSICALNPQYPWQSVPDLHIM